MKKKNWRTFRMELTGDCPTDKQKQIVNNWYELQQLRAEWDTLERKLKRPMRKYNPVVARQMEIEKRIKEIENE